MNHLCRTILLLLLGCTPAVAQEVWTGEVVWGTAAITTQGSVVELSDFYGDDVMMFMSKDQDAALRLGDVWRQGRLLMRMTADYTVNRVSAGASFRF